MQRMHHPSNKAKNNWKKANYFFMIQFNFLYIKIKVIGDQNFTA